MRGIRIMYAIATCAYLFAGTDSHPIDSRAAAKYMAGELNTPQEEAQWSSSEHTDPTQHTDQGSAEKAGARLWQARLDWIDMSWSVREAFEKADTPVKIQAAMNETHAHFNVLLRTAGSVTDLDRRRITPYIPHICTSDEHVRAVTGGIDAHNLRPLAHTFMRMLGRVTGFTFPPLEDTTDNALNDLVTVWEKVYTDRGECEHQSTYLKRACDASRGAKCIAILLAHVRGRDAVPADSVSEGLGYIESTDGDGDA
jgi:hypothetical protein